MDMKKLVQENQYKLKPFTKLEVLETMKREMAEVRPEPATHATYQKERFSNELIEDLIKDGLVVEDYEDPHAPFPLIKVSWAHLV